MRCSRAPLIPPGVWLYHDKHTSCSYLIAFIKSLCWEEKLYFLLKDDKVGSLLCWAVLSAKLDGLYVLSYSFRMCICQSWSELINQKEFPQSSMCWNDPTGKQCVRVTDNPIAIECSLGTCFFSQKLKQSKTKKQIKRRQQTKLLN